MAYPLDIKESVAYRLKYIEDKLVKTYTVPRDAGSFINIVKLIIYIDGLEFCTSKCGYRLPRDSAIALDGSKEVGKKIDLKSHDNYLTRDYDAFFLGQFIDDNPDSIACELEVKLVTLVNYQKLQDDII